MIPFSWESRALHDYSQVREQRQPLNEAILHEGVQCFLVGTKDFHYSFVSLIGAPLADLILVLSWRRFFYSGGERRNVVHRGKLCNQDVEATEVSAVFTGTPN